MEEQKLKQSQKYVPKPDNSKSNSKLFDMIPVKETPFTIVKMEDKYFLTMGKYRLSEPKQTAEECEEEAKDASWNRIMQIIQIMIEENNKEPRKVYDQKRDGENRMY